ncbi:S26 family signal peptidase [Streptomyces sp. SID13031]|uniref:S26 family signal peptidase n=1 Tax=Streptomyces sp. SID13031 TaxID=2706046 RepID=UPI0013C895E3|nr:S26 family signal peptidase [Streptomyces sp. SID13031]NEA34326.1 S26 family signal peptidase [Streptomyces sp. SID13031]
MISALLEAAAAVVVLTALGGTRWVRRTFLVVGVDGISMEPTFEAGERVLVRRLRPTALRRGDVVILRHPSVSREVAHVQIDGLQGTRLLIKRVVALPGDPAPLDKAPILTGDRSPRVPAGMVVVFGDNDGNSMDSRHLGYIPADCLVGVVLRKLNANPATRR